MLYQVKSKLNSTQSSWSVFTTQTLADGLKFKGLGIEYPSSEIVLSIESSFT
jgi:hypothetical protein